MRAAIIRFRWLLLIAAAVFVAVGVWYHIPVRRTAEMQVCSPADGSTASVSFDVEFRRYFFSPTAVSGTIVFDGVTYTTRSAVAKTPLARHGFLDRFRTKAQGRHYATYFASDASGASDGTSSDAAAGIWLVSFHGAKLDAVAIELADAADAASDAEVFYYGPAADADGANAIAAELTPDIGG